MVTENKSPRAERMMKEAIANGLLMEDGQNRSDSAENAEGKTQKPSDLTENSGGEKDNATISDFPSILVWNVYEAIKQNRKAKYSWLQDNLGVSESSIVRAINDLKKLGYINKEHSKIKGEWQLIK